MKASVLQGEFKKALVVCHETMATRTSLPICNHIVVKTMESGKVEVSATDLERWAFYEIGAQVEEAGGCCVPGGLLNELIGMYQDDKVEMTLVDDTLGLVCSRNKSSISTLKIVDFPPTPNLEGEPFVLDAQAFLSCLERVRHSVASEDMRPVLCGVLMNFHLEKGGVPLLSMVAADGFRLAIAEMPIAEVPYGHMIVLPKSLAQIVKLIKNQKAEQIEVRYSEKRGVAAFQIGPVRVVSQLIRGEFPDYKQLVPASFTTAVTVKRTEFMRAVKSVATVAKDTGGITRLYAVDGLLHVRTKGQEHNVGSSMPAKIDGPANRIAFNVAYLPDACVACPGDELAVKWIDGSNPAVFTSDSAGTYVLMPMFIQYDDDDELANQIGKETKGAK